MLGRVGAVALVLFVAVFWMWSGDSIDLMARSAKRVSNHEGDPSILPPGAPVVRDGIEVGLTSPTSMPPHHEGIEEIAAIQAPTLTAADNLPQDVARSILACWHAPQDGDEITLRMSFRRDGSVFGKPRITYMRAAGGPDGQAELANSVFAAIAACTPLRFTPSLGAAIAGRVFLIRFIAMRKEQRAAL